MIQGSLVERLRAGVPLTGEYLDTVAMQALMQEAALKIEGLNVMIDELVAIEKRINICLTTDEKDVPPYLQLCLKLILGHR